jgi:hypothetical protein
MGTNFGVTKNGVLYASGVHISGAITGSTITGGTIIGASIGCKPANATKYTFYVEGTTGHLTCNSATIGGWTVDKDGFNNGTSGTSGTYVTPGGIGYKNEKFHVDADGNLFATSATFDTSLTVKSKRSGGDTVLSVNSSG